MKPKILNPTEIQGKKLLILSDGRPGHFSQAIAFAKHLGCEYTLVNVAFKSRAAKLVSYLAAAFGVWSECLFSAQVEGRGYAAVVSAGSGTYYANLTVARQLDCAAVAIMFPRSYPLKFDLIIAQSHDNPPLRSNIIELPINLTHIEPAGIVQPAPDTKYIGIVVGGDSSHARMDAELLRLQLDQIRNLLPDHKVWLTTSPRTPAAVEQMLSEDHFDRAVFFSRERVNPIPDFLMHCDYVFVTADSSSMVSEAVSAGHAAVEVLQIAKNTPAKGKFAKLLDHLRRHGYLHIFDGTLGNATAKIDVADCLLKDPDRLRKAGVSS